MTVFYENHLLADDSHEMPSLIFSEKKKKKNVSRMLSATKYSLLLYGLMTMTVYSMVWFSLSHFIFFFFLFSVIS